MCRPRPLRGTVVTTKATSAWDAARASRKVATSHAFVCTLYASAWAPRASTAATAPDRRRYTESLSFHHTPVHLVVAAHADRAS